jgi:hypothetical protein
MARAQILWLDHGGERHWRIHVFSTLRSHLNLNVPMCTCSFPAFSDVQLRRKSELWKSFGIIIHTTPYNTWHKSLLVFSKTIMAWYIPVLLMGPKSVHYSTSELLRVVSAPTWRNGFLGRTKSQDLCKSWAVRSATEKTKNQMWQKLEMEIFSLK